MAIAVGTYAMSVGGVIAPVSTAAMAWAFTTGFLVNTAGELTMTRVDALHLAVLMLAGLAGAASRRRSTTLRRTVRRRTAPRRTPILLRRLHGARTHRSEAS
jgi:hypothetical protein